MRLGIVVAGAVCAVTATVMAFHSASAESRCDSSFQIGLSLGKSGIGPGQSMYNNMLQSARNLGCEKEFMAGNTKGFGMRTDVGDPASESYDPNKR